MFCYTFKQEFIIEKLLSHLCYGLLLIYHNCKVISKLTESIRMSRVPVLYSQHTDIHEIIQFVQLHIKFAKSGGANSPKR